jgi:hypothetical protein
VSNTYGGGGWSEFAQALGGAARVFNVYQQATGQAQSRANAAQQAPPPADDPNRETKILARLRPAKDAEFQVISSVRGRR